MNAPFGGGSAGFEFLRVPVWEKDTAAPVKRAAAIQVIARHIDEPGVCRMLLSMLGLDDTDNT